MDPIAKPTNAPAPEIKIPEDLKVLGAQFKKGFLKAMTQGVAALDKATAGTQARAKGEQILRGAKRRVNAQSICGLFEHAGKVEKSRGARGVDATDHARVGDDRNERHRRGRQGRVQPSHQTV